MSHWLYDIIRENDEERLPSYSVRAVDNWYQALRFEIEKEHGDTIAEQVGSCRQFYRDKGRNNNPIMLNNVFESLFFQ